MIIAAIAKVIYHFLIKSLSLRHSFIDVHWQLKKFINRVMNFAAEWISENGKWIFYSDRDYGGLEELNL